MVYMQFQYVKATFLSLSNYLYKTQLALFLYVTSFKVRTYIYTSYF